MGQEGHLSQPSFKACSSPELAVTNKPTQDLYPQDRLSKRVGFEDLKRNTSGGIDWDERSLPPRRSDTTWSIFSHASTDMTDTTEPDTLSPTTASFEAMNHPQYSSSPLWVESRCVSPAPIMAFHAGINARPEAGLENHHVEMAAGPVNFSNEGSSLPEHMFSPLKSRRAFWDAENVRRHMQDPTRYLLKFKRNDSMRLFQVGPPSEARHAEETLVSQITAGLRESASDQKVVLPVRLKEESGSLVSDAEPPLNTDLPDLQGMQIGGGLAKETKTDVTKEATSHDADTPTAGNESSPEGLSPLIMTSDSNELEDMETSPSPVLDAGLIQDVCEQILRQAFGTEYDDIAHTDAAGEAFNAVSYCLDELSRILPDDRLFNAAICIQELPREVGHTAPACQEGSGSNSGSGRCGRANSGSQKRPNDDGDDYPNRGSGDGSSPGDRDFGDGGNGGGSKRARMAAESGGQGLSCPFRKRNPEKFNIRDHLYCAVRPLDDITALKRHIKDHHKQKTGSVFHCQRCKEDMQSREALDVHISLPSDRICSPREGPAGRNPEDGITGQVEFWLNNRKANAKIANWESLWRILFPSDEVVPNPDFEPPVEREEFYRDLQNARSQLTETLILNEELRRSENQHPEGKHVEQLVDIFYGHIGQVFQNSRCQSRNLVRRWRSGRRNPRAENSHLGSTISPATQKQDRRHDQLAVPRPIVKKRVINGESNGGSLASSLETVDSVESWANVDQAELMATRSTPSLTGSGNVQSRQGRIAQTGVGVVASPLSLRQGRQHDFLATPSPVTPQTPTNPQANFGAHSNGFVNLNQPVQASKFHHNRQDLVDSGIEMVNHCPPVQGVNGLDNIHRADSRVIFGPSPQPQQHRPVEMNFGGPLPQQVTYQQQLRHMELAQPDHPQTAVGEAYGFGWNWTSDEMNLFQQQYQGRPSSF